MITLSTFKSAVIEGGQRVLKVLQFGAKTADECAPFGDDSSPVPNMTAIYADTSEAGEQVIIGYINSNQLAKTGEKRLYSLKEDGSVSFYLWLKNDGNLEVGGDNDNLVRFKPLKQGIDKSDALINAELVKISAAIVGLGGSYAPSDISTDILNSKINEIKCL